VPGGLAGLSSLETSQIPSAASHRVRRRHAVYDGGQVDGNGLPRFGSLSLTATPWNCDNRLGMYFRVLLPEETKHCGCPGTALFMWLAAQLAEGAAALERDPVAEGSVKRRLDRIVVDVVARLLREKH
jgi:hypothetical protein